MDYKTEAKQKAISAAKRIGVGFETSVSRFGAVEISIRFVVENFAADLAALATELEGYGFSIRQILTKQNAGDIMARINSVAYVTFSHNNK